VRYIIVALGAVAVVVAERSLTGVAEANRIWTGVIIALPFLAVFALLQWRAGKAAAAPAPPQRSPYSFGQRGPRS